MMLVMTVLTELPKKTQLSKVNVKDLEKMALNNSAILLQAQQIVSKI